MSASPMNWATTVKHFALAAPFTRLSKGSQFVYGLVQSGCNE
jgi:hypothetical protein